MTSRITYVNGRYVPSREAVVSVEDRGNQFADAVYEACQIKDGASIIAPTSRREGAGRPRRWAQATS